MTCIVGSGEEATTGAQPSTTVNAPEHGSRAGCTAPAAAPAAAAADNTAADEGNTATVAGLDGDEGEEDDAGTTTTDEAGDELSAEALAAVADDAPMTWSLMVLALTASLVPPEPRLMGPSRVHVAPKVANAGRAGSPSIDVLSATVMVAPRRIPDSCPRGGCWEMSRCAASVRGSVRGAC